MALRKFVLTMTEHRLGLRNGNNNIQQRSMKTITPHPDKPDWFLLTEAGVTLAAGSLEHCQKFATIRECFADGSTIETDETTGNRTVVGRMAHAAYFKRLREEKIFNSTPCAVIDFCVNLDGTRKCELIRKLVSNPITAAEFGPYAYEVWTNDDPQNVVRYLDFERANKAFRAAAVNGTNGFGV